ncbi:MAG: glycosyltransferase [Candidatus Thermoplasmatota archaeon]|nr:glycosyltransferase [Candidatus Thermoplasmatota archaeon]
MKKMKILAAIPCYNEEATIGSVILKARRHVDEALVIDDGSIDSTAKIAEEAGAKVIGHEENKGKAYGIKSAFKYALENDFDVVVTLDGDGQHDADEIPDLLRPVINREADMAIGFRFGRLTEMPLWRKTGKRALDYATGLKAEKVTDSQCGFRAFNRKAVEGFVHRLRGNGFSAESEQLILAKDFNLKIAEVRTSCKYKNLKTSKKNPFSHGPSVLRYILWLVAERRPLLFIGVPGLASILVGLFFGMKTLQYYSKGEVYLSGALLAIFFLIIGTLAVLMSLLLNILPHIIQRARED